MAPLGQCVFNSGVCHTLHLPLGAAFIESALDGEFLLARLCDADAREESVGCVLHDCAHFPHDSLVLVDGGCSVRAVLCFRFIFSCAFAQWLVSLSRSLSRFFFFFFFFSLRNLPLMQHICFFETASCARAIPMHPRGCACSPSTMRPR